VASKWYAIFLVAPRERKHPRHFTMCKLVFSLVSHVQLGLGRAWPEPDFELGQQAWLFYLFVKSPTPSPIWLIKHPGPKKPEPKVQSPSLDLGSIIWNIITAENYSDKSFLECIVKVSSRNSRQICIS
jgi:hypothetical protein